MQINPYQPPECPDGCLGSSKLSLSDLFRCVALHSSCAIFGASLAAMLDEVLKWLD